MIVDRNTNAWKKITGYLYSRIKEDLDFEQSKE
jgi:hypothetical protein